MPHNRCYEFGPYHLNVGKHVLTCAGETIALTLKATEILGILVTNAGQVFEKDELLKEVWPDTFVEEANLSQNVFTLRKALRDERGDPRYIKTVPRRGYRFIASVRAVAEACNGEDFRAPSAEIQLPVVAVLLLLNSTEDLDWEYLADGLTDNLINNLSRVSKLRVMSHSAVARFKAKDVNPQPAGSELGSTVVLVGKNNLRNARIVIGVELVDTEGKWPRLDCLNPYTAADLLFTLGTLLGCIAGTRRVTHGHTNAEIFLSGSIAPFEQPRRKDALSRGANRVSTLLLQAGYL